MIYLSATLTFSTLPIACRQIPDEPTVFNGDFTNPTIWRHGNPEKNEWWWWEERLLPIKITMEAASITLWDSFFMSATTYLFNQILIGVWNINFRVALLHCLRKPKSLRKVIKGVYFNAFCLIKDYTISALTLMNEKQIAGYVMSLPLTLMDAYARAQETSILFCFRFYRVKTL